MLQDSDWVSDHFGTCLKHKKINKFLEMFSQATITCSKLTIETLEQGVQYVQ